MEVDNEEHCDLRKLQRLIIGDNMVDLIDTTDSVHFSSYRAAQLRARGSKAPIGSGISMPQDEAELRLMGDNYARRAEEMKREFYAAVKAKEMDLRAWEDRIERKAKELSGGLETDRRKIEREMMEVERKLNEVNRS